MKIEHACAADLPAIRWLLNYEHLPTEDLTERLLKHFLVCRDEKGIVGAVGLEPYGDLALLRSLVVATDRRGEGLGAQLVDAVEFLAERTGRKSVYLLTTTAEKFFARRGYRIVPRAEAPIEIQRASQFSQWCPSSAVLMVRP